MKRGDLFTTDLCWYAERNIISNDARLTCRCLSVIDKSWDHRHSNVEPGCFSPIRITVWSGFAGLNHTKKGETLKRKKSKQIRGTWGAHELQQHVSALLLRWDSADHPLIPPCCLCKSHVTGLISILLLSSGWTRSSLVVCINSDSEDYRVYAAALCGREGDTVNKAVRTSWPESSAALPCPSLHRASCFPRGLASLCVQCGTWVIKVIEMTRTIIYSYTVINTFAECEWSWTLRQCCLIRLYDSGSHRTVCTWTKWKLVCLFCVDLWLFLTWDVSLERNLRVIFNPCLGKIVHWLRAGETS